MIYSNVKDSNNSQPSTAVNEAAKMDYFHRFFTIPNAYAKSSCGKNFRTQMQDIVCP
jgi:hypothetical protein